MAGIFGNIADEIKKDVMKEAEPSCASAAKELGKEVIECYKTAIDNFYGSYSPRVYLRTNTLKNKTTIGVGGRYTYFRKVTYGHGDLHYWMGFTVGSENIPGNPYLRPNSKKGYATKDWVFNNAFEKGIHGFNQYSIKKYNKNRNIYDKEGNLILSKKRWVQKTDEKGKKIVPPTTTPPVVILDNLFEKFTYDYVLGKFRW